MDWFWGGGKKKDEDPTNSLKPELKQFLKEQQPRPYAPIQTFAAEPKFEQDPVPLPDTNQKFEDRPLPRESLFQDGRYKEIWKTYVPQDTITAATNTTVERIVAAKKDRKQLISRAAFENCAFEEELAKTCWTRGTKAERARALATMCNKEQKNFNRCFTLQSKFMVALGYLTSATSSAEDEEKIQMHADKLYHRMMDYEAEADDARANGLPVPPLASVFNPARPAPTLEELDLPPNMERKLSTTLSEMPPHERELAVRATLQEAKITHMYADEYKRYAIDMNEARKSRQDWLVKVFGEPIGKFIIPDPLGSGPEAKLYALEDLDRRIAQKDEARPVDVSGVHIKAQRRWSTGAVQASPPAPHTTSYSAQKAVQYSILLGCDDMPDLQPSEKLSYTSVKSTTLISTLTRLLVLFVCVELVVHDISSHSEFNALDYIFSRIRQIPVLKDDTRAYAGCKVEVFVTSPREKRVAPPTSSRLSSPSSPPTAVAGSPATAAKARLALASSRPSLSHFASASSFDDIGLPLRYRNTVKKETSFPSGAITAIAVLSKIHARGVFEKSQALIQSRQAPRFTSLHWTLPSDTRYHAQCVKNRIVVI